MAISPDLRKLQEAQAKASAIVNAHQIPSKKEGFSMDWLAKFFKKPKEDAHVVKWVEEDGTVRES